MFVPRLRSIALLLVFVGSACGTSTSLGDVTSTTPGTTLPESSSVTPPDGASSTTSTSAPKTHELGGFPEFPAGSLPVSTASALQALLDEAVSDGTFEGVTAAVIVSDRGSWAGASGLWDGVLLKPDSQHPTHSAGKTIVAAEVLRLVEDGSLRLEDPASDHLPPELEFYDANGATIRDVLAMRSGIPDLNEDAGYYPAELAASAVDVFGQLPEAVVSPGSVTHYASTNYVLLGTIIEHTTGRRLSDAVRSDVLAHPGLEGIVYTVGTPMASDGWGIETTAASLARWGYALYGGFVISEASLREMTDFQGEWYGLGVMDLSSEFGTFAVGHQGLSSVTTCCSAIVLVALPEQGIVVAVQASTAGTPAYLDTNSRVDRLARALIDLVRG